MIPHIAPPPTLSPLKDFRVRRDYSVHGAVMELRHIQTRLGAT